MNKEKEKKNAQLILRITEKEKEFLRERAEEENRTITGIVKAALKERYKEFGKKEK